MTKWQIRPAFFALAITCLSETMSGVLQTIFLAPFLRYWSSFLGLSLFAISTHSAAAWEHWAANLPLESCRSFLVTKTIVNSSVRGNFAHRLGGRDLTVPKDHVAQWGCHPSHKCNVASCVIEIEGEAVD